MAIFRIPFSPKFASVITTKTYINLKSMKTLSKLSSQTTDQIVDLINSFVAIWNSKNAEQFGTIFTEDAEFTDIVNQIAIGKNEVIDQHRFPFAVVNKLAVLAINDLYLRSISEELVLVTAKWIAVNSMSPKGDILPERGGIIQIVAKKENSEWKIRLVHNTDITQIYSKFIDTELRYYSDKNPRQS